MRHARAFTLVELMVVVAIIVALLALLLPSLNKAMAVAQQAVCASNQKQIGVAVTTYAAQNSRYYAVGVHRSNGDWLWPATLRREIGGVMDVFNCPTADPKTQWIERLGSGAPADNFGWRANEYRLGSGRGSWFSFGMNVWGYPCCGAGSLGTGTYHDKTGGDGYQTLTTVVVPSSFIVLGDSNWDTANVGDTNWSAYIGGYAQRQYPLPIHSGKSNILHGDGHVDAMPQSSLITFTFDASINRQWNRDNQPHW